MRERNGKMLTGRRVVGVAMAAAVFVLSAMAVAAKDPQDAKTANKSKDKAAGKAEKPRLSKPLPKSDAVLAALKATADMEPKVVSGRIDKGMALKGLVVIEKDAELADDKVELTPTSGAIVINRAEAVYYKPMRIDGIPFVSISTNPKAGLKSHFNVTSKYWGAPCENVIFHGRFIFETNCVPKFIHCMFLPSPLPGFGYILQAPNVGCKDTYTYVNCLFQGIDFSLVGQNPMELWYFAVLASSSNSCGFKDLKIPAVKMEQPNGLGPWPRYCSINSHPAIYDFDKMIIPALKQLKIKDSTPFPFEALDTSKPDLPYYDKASEIRALLDGLSEKYGKD